MSPSAYRFPAPGTQQPLPRLLRPPEGGPDGDARGREPSGAHRQSWAGEHNISRCGSSRKTRLRPWPSRVGNSRPRRQPSKTHAASWPAVPSHVGGRRAAHRIRSSRPGGRTPGRWRRPERRTPRPRQSGRSSAEGRVSGDGRLCTAQRLSRKPDAGEAGPQTGRTQPRTSLDVLPDDILLCPFLRPDPPFPELGVGIQRPVGVNLDQCLEVRIPLTGEVRWYSRSPLCGQGSVSTSPASTILRSCVSNVAPNTRAVATRTRSAGSR